MAKPDWSPSPTDTMSIAAIRWFACTLEALSIELYATDRGTYPHIEKVLRKTLKELGKAKKPVVEDKQCPDGYVLCDGLCKPACLDDPPAKKRRSGERNRASRA